MRVTLDSHCTNRQVNGVFCIISKNNWRFWKVLWLVVGSNELGCRISESLIIQLLSVLKKSFSFLFVFVHRNAEKMMCCIWSITTCLCYTPLHHSKLSHGQCSVTADWDSFQIKFLQHIAKQHFLSVFSPPSCRYRQRHEKWGLQNILFVNCFHNIGFYNTDVREGHDDMHKVDKVSILTKYIKSVQMAPLIQLLSVCPYCSHTFHTVSTAKYC